MIGPAEIDEMMAEYAEADEAGDVWTNGTAPVWPAPAPAEAAPAPILPDPAP